MTPPFNLHPLHSTKEIRGHPWFRGAISRWLWRLYTHRLTRPGQWFAGMTVAFILYGTTSLDLQVFVPFTYALSIWALAMLWAQVWPPRAALTIVHGPSRVRAGTVLTLTLQIRALRRPVYDADLFAHRLPPAIDPIDWDGTALGTLRSGETQTVPVNLRCTRRGLYTLRGFRVQTDFPYGILRAYTVLPAPMAVLVTPDWSPLRGMDLPFQRSEQPGGMALATVRGEAGEFMGNREFREGDNIRDMDWRASARLDRLVVREFHEEYLHRIAFILDTFAADPEKSDPLLEGAVSLCAATGEYLARQDYSLTTLVVGPMRHNFDGIPPWAAQEQILDILAVAASNPAPLVFENDPILAGRLEEASLVVCFLLGWDDARRALIERLHEMGVALLLVLVGSSTHPDLAADEARFGPIRCVTLAQIEAGLDRL